MSLLSVAQLRRVIAVIVLYALVGVHCRVLETLSDDELRQAVSTTDLTLAYIDSGSCETVECAYSLDQLRIIASSTYTPDLRIIHVANSVSARKASPDKLPQLVFYRKTVPVLFESQNMQTDEILSWIENNKEVHSTTLDNTSFEHLTQASTGATTGDWLVLFQKPTCDELMPIWEAVAARLKHKMNVATVDISVSPELKTRFHISKCPAVIFFRLGKMYTYDLTVKEVQSFVSFAEGWYSNAPFQSVPKDPSPFDVLVDGIVSWMKNNLDVADSMPIVVGSLSLSFVILMICFFFLRRSHHELIDEKKHD